MPVGLVTGASRGFGLALSRELIRRKWHLVIDARDSRALQAAAAELGGKEELIAIPGDVGDSEHRAGLAKAVQELGALDLLVNNASSLGATPLPPLAEHPLDDFERVLQTNVLSPLALIQALLPQLTSAEGTIVNVTSDAAVEAYEGWGVYGSSKAALDRITAVLAVENPGVRIYAFDPGDMRTQMHQDAFPGEDISDRALPEEIAPALLRLIDERLPSGRYRASDLTASLETAS